MKKMMGIFLGAVLIFGSVLPVAAEVVDFGAGIRWDTTALERAKAAPGPADTEYHRVSEPGKHIPPEAPRPTFGAGWAPPRGLQRPDGGDAQLPVGSRPERRAWVLRPSCSGA